MHISYLISRAGYAGASGNQTVLPNGVALFYPRINYVSIVANDMTDDSNDVADAIATKYLTTKQLREIQYSVTEHTTKSVKFEGILKDLSVSPKRNANLVSMNFSCNMSIATKRYMQRYDLLDNEIENPHFDISDEIKRKAGLMPRQEHVLVDDAVKINADKSRTREDKSSNILDLEKLKCLPKLM